MSFDDQPTLEDDRFVLRPLSKADFEDLRHAASDPKIWEQHPINDRHKPEVFKPYFEFLLKNGGTLVTREKDNEKTIGCSRFYVMDELPNAISIGYTFLTRDHWGGDTNLAVKALMLNHAFETFPDVWLHVGPDNIRSQKATKKIGAKYVKTAPTPIVGSKGDMAWFRLRRHDWQNRASVPLDGK